MDGKCPTTMVWKCTIRNRPSAGWSNPEEEKSARCLNGAGCPTTTQLGLPVCVSPTRSMNSTPVARLPSVMIRLT